METIKLDKTVFSYNLNYIIHVNDELHLSVYSVALEIRIYGWWYH